MTIRIAIGAIAFLAILLVVIEIFAHGIRGANPFVLTNGSEQQTSERTPPPQPPMTASDTVAEQNNHPFSLLMSYTNDGFEPATARVHAGDTVRFTNNSTGQLWVAASGGKLYPNVQNGCGSSALDSCQALGPGEFWQFTFTQKGTWTFVNNLEKSRQGTVVVQ